jgi:hypothetical protein
MFYDDGWRLNDERSFLLDPALRRLALVFRPAIACGELMAK